MSAYLDLAEFLTSLDLLYRSKAQINAGAGKNDPDDVRTLLTNMIETTFANEGGAPTVITEVSQELTFGSNQVMGINDRGVQSEEYDTNYEFTLASTGNTPGYVIQVYIQADGAGTFTFSSDFVILNSSITSGGTLTADVTYLFSFLYDGDKVLVNVVETNAAAIDVTAPTLSSATIENATPSTLDLVFDEAVTITTTGWSIATDGAALSISSVASGSGTTTPKFTLSRSVLGTETVTVSYNSTIGNTVDGSGNELATFNNTSVTNNVSTYSFADNYSLVIDQLNEGWTVADNALYPSSGGGTDTAFSWSFWINTPSSFTPASFPIFGYVDSQGVIGMTVTTGALIQFKLQTSPGNNIAVQTVSSLSTNTLYFVTLTYSGSKAVGGIKLYINKVNQSVTNISAGSYTGLPSIGSGYTINVPATGLSGNYKWRNFRQFDVELSQAQINSLNTSGVPVSLAGLDTLRAACDLELQFEQNLNAEIGTNASAIGSPTYEAS